MANVTGTGTSFNLPNFAGDLFTASPTQTPFLTMIGGLSGGRKTESDEFSTGQLYEFPEASQPEISEQASETAPAASALVRSQTTNVTQIFQETIILTYAKMANRGKLSGLNAAGQQANPPSELDWQVARRLEKIARDVEHTFLNGSYNKAADASQANKTRGMFELCASGTTIAAGNQPLSVDLLKQLFRAMSEAGAAFGNMVLFCGADQKQRITTLYEKQLGYNTPAPRNVAGMNITRIETDFFELGIAYDPHVPSDRLLVDAESGAAFRYRSSIDTETCNKIKLSYNNPDTGKREIYLSQDGETLNRWGVLQYSESLQNPTGAAARADALLQLYNRKTQSLTVQKVFGDPRVRGGSAVGVVLQLEQGLTLSRYMVVEQVTHTFSQGLHRMDLDLVGGDFIA